MKLPSVRFSHLVKAGILAGCCLLALPEQADAKGPKANSKGRGHSSNQVQGRPYSGSDYNRQVYSSRPRSTFMLSLGYGYAGRGYYYGPPNSPYYYQRSEVRYFAPREASYPNSTDGSVPRELARQGYYRGYVDGQIGPQSRRAIASYQRDRGLRQTGYIDSSLLRSLGLQ